MPESFDKIPRRDVISWNGMKLLKRYAQTEFGELALEASKKIAEFYDMSQFLHPRPT